MLWIMASEFSDSCMKRDLTRKSAGEIKSVCLNTEASERQMNERIRERRMQR